MTGWLSKRKQVTGGVALAIACGLLLFARRYLDELASGESPSFSHEFLQEMTGVLSAAILLPLVARLARRFRLDQGLTVSRLTAHLAGFVLFGATHTTIMYFSRKGLYLLFGMGIYDYGYLPIRYLMELNFQLIIYTITVIVVYVTDHYRAHRKRELQLAHLETRLAESRLEALRLQLEPHFLFNTLNAISSLVYEDPRRADEMISRLGEMLRRNLQHASASEVPLSEELEAIDQYLTLMRLRMEDRMSVTINCPPELRSTGVPYLLLQPIVENALRHGADPVTGRVEIVIQVGRVGDRVEIEVRDHGPGLPPVRSESANGGIGLRNTAHRLEQLFGTGQELTVMTAPEGGAVVRIALPYRPVPTTVESISEPV